MPGDLWVRIVIVLYIFVLDLCNTFSPAGDSRPGRSQLCRVLQIW
nr:MAG TPA: hypothetical protein [Inoviridae sp.]